MKLTKEEVTQRLESIQMDECNDMETMKEFIKDIIATIVPEKYDIATKTYLTPEGYATETSDHTQGYNTAIVTIHKNVKELLSE